MSNNLVTLAARGGPEVTSEAGGHPSPPPTCTDPDHRGVTLSQTTWAHITSGHPELDRMLDQIGEAVEHPSQVLPGRTVGESLGIPADPARGRVQPILAGRQDYRYIT